MQRVVLVAPRADLDRVLAAVAQLGALHLLDLPGNGDWQPVLRAWDVGERRRSGEEKLRQVELLIDFFHPPPRRPGDPLPDVDAVARELPGWLAELESLRGGRARLRSLIDRLERVRSGAAALAAAGVALTDLGRLRLLHALCGWVREEDVPRIEESLAHTAHRVVVAGSRRGERLVVAFVPVRDRAALERTFGSVGFEPLGIPEGAAPGESGDPERSLADAQASLRALEQRFEEARERLASPLAGARAALERELLLVDACALGGRSESAAFLAGWLPVDRVDAVRGALRDATGGRCYLRADEASSLASVRAGEEAVPIQLRNPKLLRPFEQLTSEYGLPSWREIDPTPLVAVGFCAMFGLMFGDVGQGAVLAAAGAWLARGRAESAGLALLLCGVASMAFGLAYGSVFGVEGWLPALWLRPLEDFRRLLRTGAAIGLAVVGISFALGVVNAVLRRDWSRALFGTHGLLAACAYAVAASLGLRLLATGDAGASASQVWPFLALPLAILFGYRVRSESGRSNGARSPLTAILGALVELFDLVTRCVSNAVSFVRLSAFAVSHAGLLFAVFAIAETLPHSAGGEVGRALVLVLGNAIVIGLEGLIVSIQGVRLLYYEFFSRFHEGAGLRYQPLRLYAGGAEEVVR